MIIFSRIALKDIFSTLKVCDIGIIYGRCQDTSKKFKLGQLIEEYHACDYWGTLFYKHHLLF